MRCLLIAIALIFVIPMAAWAQSCACTHYCHPTVFDDGDEVCEATGVGAGPCSNQHCVDVAAAGSCVCFEMIKSVGENDLTAAIDFDTQSGAANNYITYTTPSCDPDDDSTWAIWDGQSIATNCWKLVDVADYLIIECQKFKNATGGYVVEATSVSRWHFYHGVSFFNGAAGGVNMGGLSIMLQAEAYSNGGGGVNSTGYSGFAYVTSRDNGSIGISLSSYSSGFKLISDNDSSQGIKASAASPIYNSSVYSSSGIGVLITLPPGLILNTLIEGSATYGMQVDNTGEFTYSDYNAIHDSGTADYLDISAGPHDIDPAASQFIDAASGNFTLKISAEARNAGMPVLCPNCSHVSRPDIGAWAAGRIGPPANE